jgi:hypothetical protein
VAAPDLDQGDVFAGFGQVGEAAVAELVRGAAAAGGFEDLGAAPVREPGPAGVGSMSPGGGWRAGEGDLVGQEDGASLAACEVASEEAGGYGVPEEPFAEPPLRMIWAWRLGRSRCSMSRPSSSSARAAVA